MILTERPGGDLAGHPLAAAADCLHLPSGRLHRIAGLARAIRRRHVDVVVSALSPVVVAAAGRSCGAPAILWIQNPLACVVRDLPSSRRRPRACAVRLIAAASSAVATTAPGLGDEWRRAGVPGDRLCLLPNGTRLPSEVAGDRRTGGEVRLLSVGRLAPQKRHDVTIAALAQLRSEGCPARLEILGRGPEEGALRRLAADLGVSAHVTFAGFVADPGAHYRAADAFVMSSDFEGFGNVLVEALAHGLAVVATDAPFGPRFILGDVPGARLVARGDPAAVAHAVRELLEQRRARPSLASSARRRATVFAVQRTAEHFDRIVQAVLSGGPLPAWTEPASAGAGDQSRESRGPDVHGESVDHA